MTSEALTIAIAVTAGFKSEVLDCFVGDRGCDDLTGGNFKPHMGCSRALLHVKDLTSKLVASAEFHERSHGMAALWRCVVSLQPYNTLFVLKSAMRARVCNSYRTNDSSSLYRYWLIVFCGERRG